MEAAAPKEQSTTRQPYSSFFFWRSEHPNSSVSTIKKIWFVIPNEYAAIIINENIYNVCVSIKIRVDPIFARHRVESIFIREVHRYNNGWEKVNFGSWDLVFCLTPLILFVTSFRTNWGKIHCSHLVSEIVKYSKTTFLSWFEKRDGLSDCQEQRLGFQWSEDAWNVNQGDWKWLHSSNRSTQQKQTQKKSKSGVHL